MAFTFPRAEKSCPVILSVGARQHLRIILSDLDEFGAGKTKVRMISMNR